MCVKKRKRKKNDRRDEKEISFFDRQEDDVRFINELRSHHGRDKVSLREKGKTSP